MVITLLLLSSISFSEASSLPTKKDNKKNWSVGLSHSLSRGAYYSAKTTSSHSLSLSYKYKNINFSLNNSYVYPFGYVSDPSYFGFTDTSLGASKSLKSLEGFLGFKWNAFVGLVLPTAYKSRTREKYLALFGDLSYQSQFRDIFSLSLSHILHSNFYKYQSDKSGNANLLASSSHKVQLSMRIKKITLSGAATFYIYTYFADLNSDPNISDTKLKFKAYQGGKFNLSYLIWKERNLRLNTGWSINIPVVSSVLTGFPVFNKRHWLYSFGLNWTI